MAGGLHGGMRKGTLRARKAPCRADTSQDFSRAIETVRARAGVLHLRKGTGGHSVSLGNTHPFVRDGLAFIHNGGIDGAERLAERIAPDLLAGREGTTDSELMFLRLLTVLRDGVPLEEAVTEVLREIEKGFEYTSLNFLLLTACGLFAANVFRPDAPLRRAYGPYYDLHYKTTARHVLVASSQWAEGESWPLLGNNKLLRVDKETLAITVSVLG